MSAGFWQHRIGDYMSCPMPRYTMRLCCPGEDRPNDFSLLADGKPAGRCYLMAAAGKRMVWRWTVYGISGGGMVDTLAEAQRPFKETYEALGVSSSD